MRLAAWLRGNVPENPLGIPTECFVAHSYKDRAAMCRLRRALPRGVNAYVFRRIRVGPDRMVSNRLVHAIRARPGLIYLLGGRSADSFWVALERDYALRAGKPVYAFDPATGGFTRDTSAPLPLDVFPSFSPADRDEAGRVLDFMRDHRAFDLGYYGRTDVGLEAMLGMGEQILGTIQNGGYVIAFWSARAAASRPVRQEIEAAFGYQVRLMVDQPRRDLVERRILFAALDDTPIPADGEIARYEALVREHLRHRRMEEATRPVRLTDARGRLDLRRVDDLIVRTYWLVYRNRRQSGLW
jgi:hypothetical protein